MRKGRAALAGVCPAVEIFLGVEAVVGMLDVADDRAAAAAARAAAGGE